MDPRVFDEVLIITGPTAAGKSEVALLLAEQLNGEIISMDSMAIYRGMDIGTAKPSAADRERVRHHLIDVLDPWESASVAWWLESATMACRDIQERGKQVIVVGGTPLYLKALLRGIFAGPSGDPELRRRLQGHSAAELHALLQARDPATASRLHPHDKKRLVRALEVLELTGRPISEWQQQFGTQRARHWPPLWLDLPRPDLRARINRRVERMLDSGFLDEVRRLLQQGRPLSREAAEAAGYRELLEHLSGKCMLEEAKLRIQTRSRQLAKRQVTWFRHLDECRALPITSDEPASMIAQRALQVWGLPTAGRSASQNASG